MMDCRLPRRDTNPMRGLAAVIESPDLAPLAQFPVWPVREPEQTNNAGLNLVGYTREGHQVRVAWFYHVTV